MKKCPFCAEEIQDEALKCRFCGTILDKNLKQNEVKKKKNLASRIGCGGFLGIAILIFIVLSVLGDLSLESAKKKALEQRSSQSQAENPSQKSSTSNSVGVGENGILVSQNEEVVIPVTKEYYDEMVKLSVANDTMGIAGMALDGKIFFVKTGTKVLVIDSGTFSRQVRILEGENVGLSGWVPFEFVQKAQ